MNNSLGKPHRHDGPNQYMDKHMMDGNNRMMPKDGMGQIMANICTKMVKIK